MRIYLALLIIGCAAFDAALAGLSETELREALSKVPSQLPAKQLDYLNALIEKFMNYERVHYSMKQAMLDFLEEKTNATTKWKMGYKRKFKEVIGDSCSSLIKAVSKYENDYKTLRKNPSYFPSYHVTWWFRGLDYCRDIVNNLDTYAKETFEMLA